MLVLNLQRLFKKRGIKRKYSFLKRKGFTHSTASDLSNNTTKLINLKHLELLCRVFLCLPNDLMEWIPDTDADKQSKLPLKKLIRVVPKEDVNELIQALTEEELEKLREELEKRKNGG
jgi:DNA-binding Xre family transcriptional regulator